MKQPLPSQSFQLLSRVKNRLIAALITGFPSLSGRFLKAFEPVENTDVPWTPVQKPLGTCRVALVTTAGVHMEGQPPFNMSDPAGDPTFRAIDGDVPSYALTITHDYYGHSDADKDVNIVFPIDRMREFVSEGVIGSLARTYYGFMGHILGHNVEELVRRYAPDVAKLLLADGVDVVLLTPA
ncbi:MAG: hypothetical protein HQK89_01470 [Nitrospirae bacterium]|nr:hypothetical protein [Nitrospirota bacterium]